MDYLLKKALEKLPITNNKNWKNEQADNNYPHEIGLSDYFYIIKDEENEIYESLTYSLHHHRHNLALDGHIEHVLEGIEIIVNNSTLFYDLNQVIEDVRKELLPVKNIDLFNDDIEFLSWGRKINDNITEEIHPITIEGNVKTIHNRFINVGTETDPFYLNEGIKITWEGNPFYLNGS